jgi:hypothetical protein
MLCANFILPYGGKSLWIFFLAVQLHYAINHLLESGKGGKIKAQMRLRESTLLRYIELENLTAQEIKDLQKSQRKKV